MGGLVSVLQFSLVPRDATRSPCLIFTFDFPPDVIPIPISIPIFLYAFYF